MPDREPGADPDANRWNGTDYDDHHGFVAEYGRDLLSWLDPAPGERVLDLGCGTGHLTADIADRGATVLGIDQSAEMVRSARETYPSLSFRQADAREFEPDEPFDAVFSNAALHWIPDADQDAVLRRVGRALVPGGRFVVELGGTGNVESVVAATVAELADRGYETANPWYFPTLGEYAARLESHGFEVRRAALFDRPTTLDGGEAGLANWLSMFGDSLLDPLGADERDEAVAAIEHRLRDDLYDPEADAWTADYRRLRFLAVRE